MADMEENMAVGSGADVPRSLTAAVVAVESAYAAFDGLQDEGGGHARPSGANPGGGEDAAAASALEVSASRCMGCFEPLERDAEKCPGCGHMRGAPPPEAYHLPAGTLLRGRYVVGRSLGYGGFGVTYLCFDVRLERKVAMKEYLPGEFSSRMAGDACLTIYPGEAAEQFDAGLGKFIAEAQSLARFNHIEGIVDIYDTFLENNTGYIVMQHLDGVTVKQLVRTYGTLPYEQVREIILRVLSALRVVHKEGVIHRDISPDNIFITRGGDVKLIDFGAARYATTMHTKSLSVILKPGYAPEEQYRSRGVQGPWSDIYAVAATSYKMLTGVTPPEALERNIDDALKPPSELGANIPEGAENAILNAMNVHIEDRTRTADEFIFALSDNMAVARAVASRRRGGRRGGRLGSRRGRFALRASSRSAPRRASGYDSRRASGYASRRASAAFVAAGIALVALAAACAVAVMSGLTYGGAGAVVAQPYGQGMINAPVAVNKLVGDARADLERVGLKLVVAGSEYSNKTLEGMIMSQAPQPGEPIPTGTEVRVRVSRGRPEVPDVRYWMRDAARNELERSGFKVAFADENSETAAFGSVIRQSVQPGHEHDVGGLVVLSVSIGPMEMSAQNETATPDFSGMQFAEARDLAMDEGLALAIVRSEYNKEFDEGQIIAQYPVAGAASRTGYSVLAVVSLGRTVPLPNVAHMERAEAEEALRAVGLVPVAEQEYNSLVAPGVVARQEPTPQTARGEGARVEPGSDVKIYVSLGQAGASGGGAGAGADGGGAGAGAGAGADGGGGADAAAAASGAGAGAGAGAREGEGEGEGEGAGAGAVGQTATEQPTDTTGGVRRREATPTTGASADGQAHGGSGATAAGGAQGSEADPTWAAHRDADDGAQGYGASSTQGSAEGQGHAQDPAQGATQDPAQGGDVAATTPDYSNAPTFGDETRAPPSLD